MNMKNLVEKWVKEMSILQKRKCKWYINLWKDV